MTKLGLVSILFALLFSTASWAEIKVRHPNWPQGQEIEENDLTVCRLQNVNMNPGGEVFVEVAQCSKVWHTMTIYFTGVDAAIGATLVSRVGKKIALIFRDKLDDNYIQVAVRPY